MNFYHCVADLKGKHQDPLEVGKAVFNFFLYQYDQAVSEEITARSRLRSAEAANLSGQSEYAREAEGGGFGWGYKPAYNEGQLLQMKQEAEKQATNRIEAKAMLNFVRDRLLEKFVADLPTPKKES
jgi:hypothetical protein